MTKIVTFICILAFSVISNASPNYSALSNILYPNNSEDRAFVVKLFDVVEAHKTLDPLLEGKGPSIREFSIDKIRFSLITNITPTTVDLVFFNWTLPEFQGLETQKELSELYGSNVYIMKNVNRKSIASQGQDRNQLTNFSYMLGANTFTQQILNDAPKNFQIPEQYLNWKPHPEYMDRTAPLRQCLDINTLVILSPSKEVFLDGMGISQASRPFMEAQFTKAGGFQNMIMGMMVHEMYHVKESEDQVNQFAATRKVNEDRNQIVKQLQADSLLRSLVATYVQIVFSIGNSLKNKTVSASELEMLADLTNIITELKENYPDSWKFIWNYEYTEGFAEYVSAYSMIHAGIVTLDQKIDLEIGDKSNNFAYRTGAIGGLYLANRLQEMPFKNQEDHRESLWQIILRKTQVAATPATSADLVAKYSKAAAIDTDDELRRVVDYLVSTVLEIK